MRGGHVQIDDIIPTMYQSSRASIAWLTLNNTYLSIRETLRHLKKDEVEYINQAALHECSYGHFRVIVPSIFIYWTPGQNGLRITLDGRSLKFRETIWSKTQ